MQAYYQGLLSASDPKLKTRKLSPRAKGRTIMSFDIGLERHNKNLFLGAEESEIIARLSNILEKFYGEPPFDDIDIDPSVHPPYF